MSVEWLAGLVDGEGCFTIQVVKPRYRSLRFRPRIAINMEDGSWVEKVKATLDSLNIHYYVGKLRKKKEKQLMREIVISDRDDIKKLSLILLPHLTVKKEHASIFANELPPKGMVRVGVPNGKLEEKNIKKWLSLVGKIHKLNGYSHNRKWTPKRIRAFFFPTKRMENES